MLRIPTAHPWIARLANAVAGAVGITAVAATMGLRAQAVVIDAGLVKQTRKSSPCENLPPAAALRAAQLELHQRGLSPYYWGGFVLQGEWR